MKRKLAMLLTVAITAVSVMACGGTTDTASTGSDSGASANQSDKSTDENYKIDVILKTLSSEYWQYVKAGADAAAADLGVTVDIKGPSSETAYDEMQNMIETDITSGGYDAMVIAPLQSDTVTTLVAGTKIPIFAVDTDFDAPEKISFIGTGNEEAGYEGAQAAYKAAIAAGWKEVKCIEIAGVQGDNTNTARMNGYKKGINDAGGEFLEDEVQYADAVADKAVTAMEAIMQTHPEGIAVICANNDDMAMAAARAAKGNKAYEKTIFLGFDGNRAACESILAGEETMSVIQDAYGMGYKAVETAVAYLNGEKVDEFVSKFENSGVVDKSNAQERLDTLDSYLK